MGWKVIQTNGSTNKIGTAAIAKNVVSISEFVYLIGMPKLAIARIDTIPFNINKPNLFHFEYIKRLKIESISVTIK